jgi:ribosomal protein S18 acetylase RimI-like enzyme
MLIQFLGAGIERFNRVGTVRRIRRWVPWPGLRISEPSEQPQRVGAVAWVGTVGAAVRVPSDANSRLVHAGFVLDARWFALMVGSVLVARARVELNLGGWWLQGLSVHPFFRGMGLGMRLVQSAEETEAKLGEEELRLHVGVGNVRARSLYRKLGWVELDEPESLAKIESCLASRGNPKPQILMFKRLRRP